MLGLLLALFIAVPILEIYVILQVGSIIGGGPTLAIVIAMAIAGAALAKHQGLIAVRNIQKTIATGQAIATTMVAAVLVVVAAVLMITPGFVTDGVGFVLLVPQCRNWIAKQLIAWLKTRGVRVASMGNRDEYVQDPPADVIDV